MRTSSVRLAVNKQVLNYGARWWYVHSRWTASQCGCLRDQRRLRITQCKRCLYWHDITASVCGYARRSAAVISLKFASRLNSRGVHIRAALRSLNYYTFAAISHGVVTEKKTIKRKRAMCIKQIRMTEHVLLSRAAHTYHHHHHHHHHIYLKITRKERSPLKWLPIKQKKKRRNTERNKIQKNNNATNATKQSNYNCTKS